MKALDVNTLRDACNPDEIPTAIPKFWEGLIDLFNAKPNEVTRYPGWTVAKRLISEIPPEYARRAVSSAYRVNPCDSALLAETFVDIPICPANGGELIETIEEFARCIKAYERIACGPCKHQ